jgi:hypothetical protein
MHAASATNPYPGSSNNAGTVSGQKRPRGASMPSQSQWGLKEVREADARMAASEPQRWRARLFPIDARARAAVDAYDQSLRESTLVDWRCSHNTTVKEYAGRIQPIVEQAQQRCMVRCCCASLAGSLLMFLMDRNSSNGVWLQTRSHSGAHLTLMIIQSM